MNADTRPGAPIARPKFQLVPIAEIDFFRGSPDLVRGLLPRSGLGVIFGPSGCGKSFLALDVALHVAMGRAWAFQRTEPAGVVYIAAEGAEGFRRRVVAARDRLGAWEAQFAMIAAAPNLGASPGDGPELVASIRSQTLSQGWSPGLVVIDTTARVIPGVEENSLKDMGRFVDNADLIARELRCLVLLVHHTGKNPEAGMRGSTALHGAADVEWSVSIEDGVRSVRLAKSKDGADNLAWSFALAVVEIGTDDDGEPITTCVVENVTEPSFGGTAKPKRLTYPPSLKLLMAAFTAALSDHGEDVRPFRDGPIVRAVARDHIRDAFIERHSADDTDSRTRAFRRAIASAVERRELISAEVDRRPFIWQP